MSISEECSCGSKIDFVPGLDINVAARLVRDWRKGHRHDNNKVEAEQKPMGFNLSAVSSDSHDGEGDTEWQGMFAAPDA